jgi:hypothetical protein
MEREMSDEEMIRYTERSTELKEIVKQHGFYWSVLTGDEQIMYEIAQTRVGLDDEINLLKIKIQSVAMLASVQAMSMLTRMIMCLDRLLKTNKIVFKKGEIDHLTQAVRNVFQDIHLPQKAIDDYLEKTAPAF